MVASRFTATPHRANGRIEQQPSCGATAPEQAFSSRSVTCWHAATAPGAAPWIRCSVRYAKPRQSVHCGKLGRLVRSIWISDLSSARAKSDLTESDFTLFLFEWSHFLRRTGVHFAGKCSNTKINSLSRVLGTLGVVHVFAAGKATKYRLSKQPRQGVPAILACARIGEFLACHRSRPEHVVEFAIGQQSGIGCDQGAAKLNRQAAVKIELDNPGVRFTRWVRHHRLARSRIRR
jgi:hypothetical protein